MKIIFYLVMNAVMHYSLRNDYIDREQYCAGDVEEDLQVKVKICILKVCPSVEATGKLKYPHTLPCSGT